MLAQLAERLTDDPCDRAHVITAAYLTAFGKGVRWREQLTRMGVGPSQAMLDALRGCVVADNPFVGGFDAGFLFERLGKHD